jgi:two-component system sensor histidine kinase KdpD
MGHTRSAQDSARDPEALLRQLEAAERSERRGQLKIFLGYASGVGKSFKLFDEGRRRHERGEDVVIAATQPEIPPDIEAVIGSIDMIRCRENAGIPVIDVPALIARHPQVCLIDGLAYDNPPGSRHAERYQDVEELIEAGISVITSINLEYIAEQQEFVRSVLGKAPAQVVPQAFIQGADEIVVVDAPAETDTALEAHQLSLLRQRALLLAADVVDRQLEEYLQLHGGRAGGAGGSGRSSGSGAGTAAGSAPGPSASAVASTWGTQERILVCMTPRANAAVMLESGRRNADRFHGELFAIYVMQDSLTEEDKMALERNATLARAQHAQVDVLEGRDPVATILDYARSHGITQIFVGHNLRRTWGARIRGTPLDQLIRDAEGIDVRVFPH